MASICLNQEAEVHSTWLSRQNYLLILWYVMIMKCVVIDRLWELVYGDGYVSFIRQPRIWWVFWRDSLEQHQRRIRSCKTSERTSQILLTVETSEGGQNEFCAVLKPTELYLPGTVGAMRLKWGWKPGCVAGGIMGQEKRWPGLPSPCGKEIHELGETVFGVSSPLVLLCGGTVELTVVTLLYGTVGPLEAGRELLLGTRHEVLLGSSRFMAVPYLSGVRVM